MENERKTQGAWVVTVKSYDAEQAEDAEPLKEENSQEEEKKGDVK